MKLSITIHSDMGTPIYQQIVDAVYEAIRDGRLVPGEKLPTVRELADEMDLARGTIKRAYDELEKMGIIQMTQGRGTFVLEREDQESGSRKERAMKAIDHLLDELEELSFSPKEMRIFFDLKLRDRVERSCNINVAAVDCNPEALSMISEQLSDLQGVDLYKFLLEDLRHRANRLGENMDLIVTTYNHSQELEELVEDSAHILRVVMAPARETVIQLAKLRPGQRLGLMAASERFIQIMSRGCAALAGREHPAQGRLFGREGALEDFLKDQDVLVVPPDYAGLASPEELEAIHAFAVRGQVIPYRYQLDAGSFMHLEEQIAQLQTQKHGSKGK